MGRLNRVLAVLLIALTGALSLSARASEADVQRVWQILDYLAADYAGALQDGRIVSPSEFAEMQEFAQTARAKIAALDAGPEQPSLLRAADELRHAIDAKADASKVAALATQLGNRLLAAYPMPLAPAAAPDVQAGARLYAAECAGCHGAAGRGDGPLAQALEPKPTAFTDRSRAQQRSVFALYQAVTQGIPGTAMPAFAQLSDQDRWALATFIGSFAHDPAQLARGKALWSAQPDARAAVGGLAGFVRMTEADLAAAVGPVQAAELMAYLHTETQALAESRTSGLSLARERLQQSVAAYQAGDAKRAADLALSSYLDGVEPYEQALAARDGALKAEIETAMGRYRSLIAAHAPAPQVQQQAGSIEPLFAAADEALAPSRADAAAAFVASLTILLREGIEALLVVVAMIAFLRKAERPELLPYVHAGWIGALALGGATWAAATWLVSISGANREVTEGLSSLFAAAVLLSVGVWMHQKSLAGQWQAYLRDRMSAALSRRSAFFLFGLAFIAVYREVFETILFYAALWGQGTDGAIVAGLAAGAVCLAVIAFVLLRFSARLPIGQFFTFSAWLVAALAVVLTGKGIAALQEAGWIAPTAIHGPRIEMLGVYPSVVGLLAQAAVLIAVLAFFLRNSHRPAAAH